MLDLTISTKEDVESKGIDMSLLNSGRGVVKISVEQLFGLTYSGYQPCNYPSTKRDVTIPTPAKRRRECIGVVYVKTQTGKTLTVEITDLMTVLELKLMIEEMEGIPVVQQRIMFASCQACDTRSLKECGILPDATICLLLKLQGGGKTIYYLDSDILDPAYDFDFTEMSETDGEIFKRGGYVYKRPYGWKRIALKVKGKYESDEWLGTCGIRRESSSGEWPVSYHGTKMDSAKCIAKAGYDDQQLQRQLFGKGHYSSPNIEIAEKYATLFQFEGVNYKMILQNRVNPESTIMIPKEKTHDIDEYWVTKKAIDLRPYGICIKRI